LSPTPTSLSIESKIYGMALSPSGRRLAVAHAGGAWKATLWDLVDSRQVAESPQAHAVTWVGFTSDERAMVSISCQNADGRIVFEPVDGAPSRVLPLEHANRAAIHPAGQKLAVSDNRNRLTVVDIATLNVDRAHFVGGRRTVGAIEQDLTARLKASVAVLDYD